MSLDTRRTRHGASCACVDGAIGARTTRSAALGRHDDSLAARRSLGVTGAGSDRAVPAMRRGESGTERGEGGRGARLGRRRRVGVSSGADVSAGKVFSPHA